MLGQYSSSCEFIMIGWRCSANLFVFVFIYCLALRHHGHRDCLYKTISLYYCIVYPLRYENKQKKNRLHKCVAALCRHVQLMWHTTCTASKVKILTTLRMKKKHLRKIGFTLLIFSTCILSLLFYKLIESVTRSCLLSVQATSRASPIVVLSFSIFLFSIWLAPKIINKNRMNFAARK